MRLRREGAETGAEDLSLKSEAVTVDDKRVEGHADVMVTLDDDDEEKSEEEEAKVETIAPSKDEEKVEAEPSNALALSVSFLEEETEIIAEDARAAAEPVDGARTVDDDESPSAKDQMPSSPTRADDIEAPRSAPGSPPDSAPGSPPGSAPGSVPGSAPESPPSPGAERAAARAEAAAAMPPPGPSLASQSPRCFRPCLHRSPRRRRAGGVPHAGRFRSGGIASVA